MRLLAIGCFVILSICPLFAQERAHVHRDGRDGINLLINPSQPAGAQKAGLASVKDYLAREAHRFGLKAGGDSVLHQETRESLTGKHYVFQQYLDGVPIEGAQIVVSQKDDGKIFRVYSNVFPITGEAFPGNQVAGNAADLIGPEGALETGWLKLGVYGRLLTKPGARLVYLPKDGGFELAYRVRLAVTDPAGDWAIAIDAKDGSVLDMRDISMHTRNHRQDEAAGDTPNYQGPLTDFTAELARFEREQTALEQKRANEANKRAQGTGVVFDPDPVTALLNDTLEDFSPASAFNGAYVTRTLNDITNNNGVWSLSGPWVDLRQNDGGGVPPSTTTDGNWTANRGDNAFNDTMVYYHIDQSQRYIQSLGFTGAMGIQEGQMSADSDALSGSDNSRFISPNILQFGRGCVDDAEDADVILHEYGHAIQHAIVSTWGLSSASDEGGMGEGFGDYWAGSYSLITANGRFNPNRVFTWDGHNSCWTGRTMNKTQMIYNSTINHGPHQSVDGGVTDELWSTPLFQTLLELYNTGIPREQVDQIVLESHFGLGSSLKMPVVADATVQAAALLYPDGPHAYLFQQAFSRHGIIDAQEEYTYIAPHVPPSRGNNDWQNEILLHNPDSVEATVMVFVYQADSTTIGLDEYGLLTQNTFTLEPGESRVYEPDGSKQRWVRFVADKPIAGYSTFRRNPSEELGTEQATIPLFNYIQQSQDLILPHVPADRASFWSGAVILNPNDEEMNIQIDLIGADGSNLNNLLADGTPTVLDGRAKWVTLLADGLFDDNASSEKVSYVRVRSLSGNDLTAFQLYGYNGGNSEVATAGIVAMPDQVRSTWPLRVDRVESDFTAFSVLNPSDAASDLNVRAYGPNGSLLAEATVQLGSSAKALGLHTATGFVFPTDDPQINLSADQAAHITIQSDAPLRIFELAGDNANTVLDGSAVLGMTTDSIFLNPTGTLQIFKADFDGDVDMTVIDGDGGVVNQSFSLSAGETMDYQVPANSRSIALNGEAYFSSLISRDSQANTLTVIGGPQVDWLFKEGEVEPDDHGNTPETATLVNITGGTIDGVIDTGADADYFRFDITQAGTLSLYTTGQTDTVGELFDEFGESLFMNDDSNGASDRNFRIDFGVVPGVYYLEVIGWGGQTVGPYTLNIEFE
jgi:hypothetical protein